MASLGGEKNSQMQLGFVDLSLTPTFYLTTTTSQKRVFGGTLEISKKTRFNVGESGFRGYLLFLL